ncbi:MAG: GlgB N-terminal domain-containing protein, partial [Pseudomonadota bacterium]
MSGKPLDRETIAALCEGRHGDPFAVLGPHGAFGARGALRAFLPGAAEVQARTLPAAGARRAGRATPLHCVDPAGLFEGPRPSRPYRLEVTWADGNRSTLDDPYRFGPVLGELDVWLLSEGTHLRPFEVLGAHPREHEEVAGVAFAVWAPTASRVSGVGDFNLWDGRRHP